MSSSSCEFTWDIFKLESRWRRALCINAWWRIELRGLYKDPRDEPDCSLLISQCIVVQVHYQEISDLDNEVDYFYLITLLPWFNRGEKKEKRKRKIHPSHRISYIVWFWRQSFALLEATMATWQSELGPRTRDITYPCRSGFEPFHFRSPTAFLPPPHTYCSQCLGGRGGAI